MLALACDFSKAKKKWNHNPSCIHCLAVWSNSSFPSSAVRLIFQVCFQYRDAYWNCLMRAGADSLQLFFFVVVPSLEQTLERHWSGRSVYESSRSDTLKQTHCEWCLEFTISFKTTSQHKVVVCTYEQTVKYYNKMLAKYVILLMVKTSKSFLIKTTNLILKCNVVLIYR